MASLTSSSWSSTLHPLRRPYRLVYLPSCVGSCSNETRDCVVMIRHENFLESDVAKVNITRLGLCPSMYFKISSLSFHTL